MKIVIPEIPPSNNKFIGKNKAWEYRKIKQAWYWIVLSALPSRLKKPMEKAVVHITYYFPDRRRRDPDNYAGKMLLDPLVQLGIIKDDSFGHIRLVLDGACDPEYPRTEIEVESDELQLQGEETGREKPKSD